jgi:hypothetical protein
LQTPGGSSRVAACSLHGNRSVTPTLAAAATQGQIIIWFG